MVPQASELFLQRMMALYVSSHYKNTPNDLLLMSDAPAHHLFVLLGPVDETQVRFWCLCFVCGGLTMYGVSAMAVLLCCVHQTQLPLLHTSHVFGDAFRAVMTGAWG